VVENLTHLGFDFRTRGFATGKKFLQMPLTGRI